MKVTVVPAQITTVEDRVAGNLGVSQLLLLALPIFGGSLLYVILPPFMGSASYKLVIMTVLAVLCGVSAIRIKGKIMLLWIIILLRYKIRPRYYVFTKQSSYGRELEHMEQESEATEETEELSAATKQVVGLSIAEQVRLQRMLNHPNADMSFKTKKGELYVSITKVTEES